MKNQVSRTSEAARQRRSDAIELSSMGLAMRDIARVLGVHGSTIRRYLRGADDAPVSKNQRTWIREMYGDRLSRLGLL